ncbi:hypothetical protein U1Q18_027292, partial [Sarracenia purpurea var. burkii]
STSTVQVQPHVNSWLSLMLLLQRCSHALPQVPSTHHPIPSPTVPRSGIQQITVFDAYTRQPIAATGPPEHSNTTHAISTIANSTNTVANSTDRATNSPDRAANSLDTAIGTSPIATGTAPIATTTAAPIFATECVSSSTNSHLSNHHPIYTRSKSGFNRALMVADPVGFFGDAQADGDTTKSKHCRCRSKHFQALGA